MPTINGTKRSFSSPLSSIITKNTFYGLPYVTKYVWFKPKIGTLFNFCQLLCTFLRYVYSIIPSIVMLSHVSEVTGVSFRCSMRVRNRLKSGLTGICNQIDRFTPRLSDMIGTIYRLKQGATTMPTNFWPQMWFQVIISVIGRWCQNEICTPVP